MPAFPAPAAHLSLDTEVQFVKGVGPAVARILAGRGVHTVEDLIQTLPFRYEDRSRQRNVRELCEGEAGLVVAQVHSLAFSRTRSGITTLEMLVGDGTGMLRCGWFHADFLRERFHSGQTLALFGRLVREQGRLLLRQPEFEILEAPAPEPLAPVAGGEAGCPRSLKLGRIVPVYEAIASLGAARLRRLVHAALEALPQELPDPLPQALRTALQLPGRRAALEAVHFPAPETPLEALQEARTPGHRRLIFEELFFLQAGLELKRRKLQRQPAPVMAVNASIRERLKRLLPFHPTAGQKQVLGEIVADLCSGRPMRRLLQGDVGSGKTIVALEAAVVAIENGYQVALMVPTQILAEQHAYYARQRLPDYRIGLVTGGRKARPAAAAWPQLVIGTQALLERRFRFERLGLVIVDEQHRFGVLQRFHLMHRGTSGEPAAHVLVMTATPIPRSLALTLYGDLDASTLRESPPGARPILTRVVEATRSPQVYEFVRQQLQAGRQAYFVYPIIEESETLALKPALAMFTHLQQTYPELRLGLLHGRMKAEEKNTVMEDFRAGRLQALVCTTVIEVGLDVPNAAVMVIEHAERFGIAQLHQLRGRVGRPDPRRRQERSYCFLLHGERETAAARQRLRALAETRDGFQLAELDLKLRGPGEFFGTRQSGLPALQIAQPVRDQQLLELARQQARDYLDTADAEAQRRLVLHIQRHWQRHYGLVEAG